MLIFLVLAPLAGTQGLIQSTSASGHAVGIQAPVVALHSDQTDLAVRAVSDGWESMPASIDFRVPDMELVTTRDIWSFVDSAAQDFLVCYAGAESRRCRHVSRQLGSTRRYRNPKRCGNARLTLACADCRPVSSSPAAPNFWNGEVVFPLMRQRLSAGHSAHRAFAGPATSMNR